MSYLIASPTNRLIGTVNAPGDKSISHRSLILGAMAEGVTKISGLLEGADILSTAKAMKAFGADVRQLGDGHWEVGGLGEKGFQEPNDFIDFGNAGIEPQSAKSNERKTYI